MPNYRRKLSAALHDFHRELSFLERFDANNQKKFSTGAGVITKNQMHFLTEAIFFRCFRAYERFIRDVFLLYCLERKPTSGEEVKSHLKPSNFLHAEELIRSTQRFLDWSNTDQVISRAELYLEGGFPIKAPYTRDRVFLDELRLIRNQIAHDSKESMDGYKRILLNHYGTIPIRIPVPGEFLLVTDRHDPTKYKLLVVFNELRRISTDLT